MGEKFPFLTIVLFLFFMPFTVAGEELVSVSGNAATQSFNDTINRLDPDFVTVSLVVCDPYEVLYSSLGHAALHLQCPVYDLDYVFSYESEGVRDKVWTYLKGDLKMGMYAFPADVFWEIYRYAGRGVKEYKMNLSPEQEQELWRVMDNMQTAGMTLPYDYFRRGCAKSVVQVLHKAIGKDGIHYAPWSEKYTEHTIRELVRESLTEVPWTEFVLYFLIGSEAEKPMTCEQKLIVPTDLVEVWQQATLDNGKPVLQAEPHIVLEPATRNKGTWCTPLLVSIILLLLACGSLATLWTKRKTLRVAGKVIDYTILVVVTALGVLMTYLVCLSSLPCTHWNWLIIPFNILPAVVWYWRRYWALPYAVVLTVWMLAMIIYPHWLVDVPHLILTLAWTLVLVKQRINV